MIKASALKALASLANHAIKTDAISRARLQKIANKSFFIECFDPDIHLLIRIDEQGFIQLQAEHVDNADVQLQGRFSAFVELFSSKDQASALINSELSLKGNSQILVELVESLQQMDLDWEYQLAKIMGDLPAHFIGSLSRHSGRWLAEAAPAFKRHCKEFILEEAHLIPRAEEIEEFIQQVQGLKLRSERLEAKIQRLQKED